MIYATGLRLSKVAYLRLTDLDRIRRLIHVRRGKGKKDRVVMLTDKLEMILDTYMARYRPKTYLFEVVVSDESLQNCSIQQVYSDTVRLAGALNEGEFIPCLIHLLRTY
ncbi:Phage integrase family protein [Spirosoma endophyticum]|uniref:Phage integrase family protein n=1 Tax=Spirosoma endophyticum TaxID=662367 RepID=A0A1I1KX94_9BACT|nr:Phage integrase family protein [Spirosoma endophyticum]